MKEIVEMEQVKPVYKEDDVNRYNHPYHELYDGTKIPYGHVCDDGIYRLCFDTTSRYGYMAHAIYVTYHKFNDDGYPNHMYHVFVGECPHKDENGNWVTYNEVPNFLIGAFGGAHYIDAEPDIPHILDIQTDEFWHERKKRSEDSYSKIFQENKKLEKKMTYCTLSMYLNGLKNRILKHIGYITYIKGETNSNVLSYTSPSCKRIVFVNNWRNGDRYVYFETDETLRFLYFIQNHKLSLKYDKRHNDHCSSSC